MITSGTTPFAPTTTPTRPTPQDWRRYVAIGDSFTEGMVDPDPGRDGAFRGWADRLAEHLAERTDRRTDEGGDTPFGYANLAIRGRRLDDVVGPQLDAALELRPDLVSVVGGGNDILRPKVDLDTIADRVEQAVIRIRATGADVLLATPVDPVEAGLLSALRPRHAVHTANLFTIAQRHGAYVLNLWTLRALRDMRMWGEDRIHLSPEGHRRVALAALDALGHDTEAADWTTRPDPLPPVSRRERVGAGARWTWAYAGPWVQRRLRGTSSGDSVIAKRPELTPVRR